MVYKYPQSSTDGVVISENGIASLLGSMILNEGGNAVDAAVVTSLTLGITLPHLGGLGGDFFALVKIGSEVVFIDGSGPSPADLSIAYMARKGYKQMPSRGPLTITVPGMIDSLYSMWKKFGKLEWGHLVEVVSKLAKKGFPAPYSLATATRRNHDILSMDPGSAYTFLGISRPYTLVKFEGASKALNLIAEDHRSYYEGDIAEKISSYVRERGGVLGAEDLASYKASIVNPLKLEYENCTIYEGPPPTQGATTLFMLKVLSSYYREILEQTGPNSYERVELLAKLVQPAYLFRDRHITDPSFMKIDPYGLLDDKLVEATMEELSRLRSQTITSRRDIGDTTFFVVGDKNGNLVAGIQSLYNHFGSGLTEPNYQIPLNNRGSDFSLDHNHINRLEPRKRTLHTLSAMIVDCSEKVYAIGTSGGHYRPQLHWWFLTNILHYSMSIQEAIEYPRVLLDVRSKIAVYEEGISVREDFEVKYGYKLQQLKYPSRTGVASIIELSPGPILVGGTDIRGEGVSIPAYLDHPLER